VTSARAYLLVDLALLVLTAATIGLAHLDLHGFNTAVALAIAGLKAALIALFFMHLRASPPLTRLVGVAALLWLGILMVGTLDELLTRAWLPVPGK
jgi:cytochrome c oxidase subunit IV